MDVVEVYNATSRLIERARSGQGPAMLECKTYRFEDHSKSTAAQKLQYRTNEEVENWKKKDPIITWPERLIKEDICTREDIQKMDELVEKQIDEGVEFAQNSPLPEDEAAFKYMYATECAGIPQRGW